MTRSSYEPAGTDPRVYWPLRFVTAVRLVLPSSSRAPGTGSLFNWSVTTPLITPCWAHAGRARAASSTMPKAPNRALRLGYRMVCLRLLVESVELGHQQTEV